MTENHDETQIRQLFRELKRQEERITPSFSKNWGEARSRHKPVRPFQRYLNVATGVAVALVLIMTLPLFRSEFVRRPRHDLPKVYSITEWEPLTDFLLEFPGDQLLTAVPQLDYLTLETGRFPSEQNPQSSGSAL